MSVFFMKYRYIIRLFNICLLLGSLSFLFSANAKTSCRNFFEQGQKRNEIAFDDGIQPFAKIQVREIEQKCIDDLKKRPNDRELKLSLAMSYFYQNKDNKSLTIFRQLAYQGNADAVVMVFTLLLGGNSSPTTKDIKSLKNIAENDNSKAQNLLAFICDYNTNWLGDYCLKNHDEIGDMLKKSAVKGDKYSQFAYAVYLGERSPDTSINWFIKSAEQGLISSIKMLTYRVHHLPLNKSKKLLGTIISLSNQGNENIDLLLGSIFSGEDIMYGANKEVVSDKKAFYWFNQAAEKGNPTAQYLIARIYLRDLHDEEKGKYWLKKAEAQGSPDARVALEQLFYRKP